MIGISKLYCGTVEPSDLLRYGRQAAQLPSHLLQFSQDKKPVVVWNITRACNLACDHCYADATTQVAHDELSYDENIALVDHLVEYKVPVILFSGGEPLMHPHIMELIGRATKGGVRAVLSTNGLLIDQATAVQLKGLGLSYIGISLDGLAEAHDRLRHLPGAFKRTVAAMNIARKAGLKVGLRLTLNRRNIADLPAIFDLMAQEDIRRVCFYHLVASGRGSKMEEQTINHEQTRAAVDYITERTALELKQGRPLEVLTVDNHADGPYLYLKALGEDFEGQEGPESLKSKESRESRKPNRRAQNILELLSLNGGNSSGHGIGAISWNGLVHPDQFWRRVVLGSIREKTFAQIWHDPQNSLLQALKNKKDHITGRCSLCRFLALCGGNLRARAEAATGDRWASDPACYLTDQEISGPPLNLTPNLTMTKQV